MSEIFTFDALNLRLNSEFSFLIKCIKRCKQIMQLIPYIRGPKPTVSSTKFHIVKFKVCKTVHHHTIQINHQLDATVSPVYYPDVYLQLNMFRASSRPSSGTQQLQ